MRLVPVIIAAMLLSACGDEPRPRRQDPSRQNPPSKGVIDIPAENQVVGPSIIVGGWAIDESGIDRVRIYADDRLVASVPLTGARPDVEKIFPGYGPPGTLHGWGAEVDFGDKVGYTTLRAEALDKNGALTRFANVTVQVQQ